MDRHASKVSRIEHGSATPSEDDIRAWCRHCGAEGQIPDLIASLHAVETMWVEWRRMEQSGLKHAQKARLPLYQRTRQFRIYTPSILPGVLQTKAYTTAVLAAIGRRRAVADDLGEAVAARMERQHVLHDTRRRFACLIEESALAAGFGAAEVMIGQLGHLIAMSALPNVSLGILPFRPDRDAAWPVEAFYMFDNEQVAVELVSGHLTVTQPREIAMYAQVFAELSDSAQFGAPHTLGSWPPSTQSPPNDASAQPRAHSLSCDPLNT